MTALWFALSAFGLGLLAFTWLLYPAFTTRRAARRPVPEPHPLPAPAPLVSVILATREPAEHIRLRLEDLLATGYPLDRIEVVVAIDGDQEVAVPEAAGRALARCIVTRADAPGGKACALNAAVRSAAGEILVFTDTQQRFDPEAIPRLVAAVRRGPWSVVSGALHVAGAGGRSNLLTRYWEAERELRAAEARIHSAVGVTGAIYAMRRDRWDALPPGLILDDLYVPMRAVLAGERVGFEAGASATDARTTLPAQEFRRKVRTLTGNLQLCAWLPGVLSPRRNPIWFAFVSHKLLRLLTPYALLGLLIGAVGLWLELAPGTIAIPLGALGLLLLLILFGRDRLSRQLRSAAWWVVAMQAATVVAAINGIRGNWKVWQHPSRARAGP